MSNVKSTIDTAIIKKLASMFEHTDLTEIEVETEDMKIRVARTPAPQTIYMNSSPQHTPNVNIPQTANMHGSNAQNSGMPTVEQAPTKPKATENALISPMVGTAYRSAAPDKPAFVEIGSKVVKGQTVIIIEAMKTFNEIPAPRDGTITAIFVESGQPVEYGEPILVIE